MMLAVVALAVSGPATCPRVSSKVEQLICNDEQLRRFDAALMAIVRTAPSKRVEYRRWLVQRNKCAARSCLVDTYETRLLDAISEGTTGARHYRSRPNDGDLDILALGGGWFVFSVVGKWATGNGSWNFAEQGGSFRLDAKGIAVNKPADEDDCGWKVERLAGDRWRVSTITSKPISGFECYGLNATIDGTYSSSQRKSQ